MPQNFTILDLTSVNISLLITTIDMNHLYLHVCFARINISILARVHYISDLSGNRLDTTVSKHFNVKSIVCITQLLTFLCLILE